MAYVIAEPCIRTKDTACVDACPVDCIHPKKDAPTNSSLPSSSTSIRWSVLTAEPVFPFVLSLQFLSWTSCRKSGKISPRKTPTTFKNKQAGTGLRSTKTACASRAVFYCWLLEERPERAAARAAAATGAYERRCSGVGPCLCSIALWAGVG